MAEGTAPLFVNWRTGEPLTVVEGIGTASITNSQLAGPIVTTSFTLGTASVTNAMLAGPIVAIIGTASIVNNQLAGPIISLIGTASISSEKITPRPGLEYLTSGTISNGTTNLDIVLTSYTAYRGILIKLINITPSTAAALLMRVSTNGGSSYDSGGSDYAWSWQRWAGGISFDGSDSADSQMRFVDSGGAETIQASIEFMDQSNAGARTIFRFNGANNEEERYEANGSRLTNQDTDAVRIFYATGTFTSGSYAVYGYV